MRAREGWPPSEVSPAASDAIGMEDCGQTYRARAAGGRARGSGGLRAGYWVCLSPRIRPASAKDRCVAHDPARLTGGLMMLVGG